MRRPALAVLAFLGLSAFGPPPSDPAGPSPLTRAADARQDHSWQPPAYGQQTLPDAQPVTPTPLGSRATCVPSRQEVSQGPCVPAANGWGPGTRFTYFMDGCGGTFQESASCYTACPGSPWEYQAPSACVPSNGNMGPGTITSYQSNSCGAFWTTSEGCCAEGDQVTSESACVPNSGQYGPGRVTKVHNNGCGRQWDEHVACEVPAPAGEWVYFPISTDALFTGHFPGGITSYAMFRGCMNGSGAMVPESDCPAGTMPARDMCVADSSGWGCCGDARLTGVGFQQQNFAMRRVYGSQYWQCN